MSDQITGFLSPWLRERRLKMVRSYVQGRVLDYGCGVGVLTEMCKPDFYLGVDIDKESIGIAKRTIHRAWSGGVAALANLAGT